MAKKKTQKKKVTQKKVGSKHLHHWECPHENSFLLRPETILLSILVILVLVFSFVTFEQSWIPTITLTIVFVLMFVVINYFLRKLHPVKEEYKMTHTGISIYKKSGKKTDTIYIPYVAIKKFKLDKLFHGGRIETATKRHPLFFNTLEEIEKLEKIFAKKLKI